MPIPLFHETNTFTVYKKNEELKRINFTGHKVSLYYKLYSVLKKKHDYHLQTSTVRDITGRVLMNGSFIDILMRLIEELKKKYKYSIISYNREGIEVYHWYDDEEGVASQLMNLKEKYTKSGDPRLFRKVQVLDNESQRSMYESLDDLIDMFRTTKDAKEPEFGLYLSFEEVLEDMRPFIVNGSDKEKIEAKAILAYVAAKLVEKQLGQT